MYFKAMICDIDDACVYWGEGDRNGEFLFGCFAGVQRHWWCAD